MDQQENPGPFSRRQVIVLSVLVALFAAGVFLLKHRGRVAPGEVELARGNPEEYRLVLDVNSATWQELSLLPGIGEEKARRIVAWREEHGPLEKLSDLEKVSGIGPKTAAAAEPYLTFGEPRE